MENNILVSVFLFKEDWEVLMDAARLPPAYEVNKFSEISEIVNSMSAQSASLVISSVSEKDDLVKLANLMKASKHLIKDGAVKFVVVNFSNNKLFDKAISKLGILDILEPQINQKALKYKLDFWMKSLSAQIKKSTPEMKVNTRPKSSEVCATNQPETQTIQWSDPLSIEDDVWLVKGPEDFKLVLGKWVLRILGPGPLVAQWVPVKMRNDLWRFDINEDSKQNFLKGVETWYFQGEQKPDFVWKDNVWMFTGDQFDLYRMHNGKHYSRFKCKDKVLTITQNSVVAKVKEKLILESLDKELVVRSESEGGATGLTLDEVSGNEGGDMPGGI